MNCHHRDRDPPSDRRTLIPASRDVSNAITRISEGRRRSDGRRAMQAYRTGNASASPLLATNKRFAEETNKLNRQSTGHGGIMCEGCHGCIHAVWPNANDAANDNVAAVTLQGYSGKVSECTVCHVQGSLPLITNGPHGLH